MKKASFLALVALTLGTFAPAARAQTEFGIGGGFDTDADAAFLTAQARTARGVSFPVRFNPQFDFYLPGDNLTQFQGNLNVLYDFGTNNVAFIPYAGIGLGVGYWKPDNVDADISLGANFLFGAEFGPNSRVRPYVQLQISTTKATGAAVAGGVLFGF
ncbi:MAG TPA: P44/Msp2 family outer membrane protein [Rhodothermales bacterium]|nr:P44/Msp2 family outer membrane protein [Rhodothermales bacterium]